jgi:predicted ATPase
VIGRGFSYKLLKAVAGTDDMPLEAALEKLSGADIVLVEGVLPESGYRFKHALIQDAAYENLLKSRRQVLHRRIAETLRDRFADRAAAEPEVLAHHFTQAGLTDAAIEWWGKAGDQALRRSAFLEAISHLGKAIDMADKVNGAATAVSASSSQRLKLQTSYGQAVMWYKGYGAEETTAAFARARELAKTSGNLADRFAAYYGQWVNSGMRGGHESVHEIAEIYLQEAEREQVAREITTARRMLGLSRHMQGDFSEAKAHLDEALRVYDPQWSHDEKFRVSLEPGLTVMVYLASTEWLLGHAARARDLVKGAVARSVEAAHVPTLGSSYAFAAQLEALRQDANAAMRAGEAAAEYTHEHGLGLYQSMARVYHGWALARLGKRQAGMAELERGLASHTEAGNKAWTPFFQGLYAEIEAEEGGSERGLNRLDEALALAAEIGEHWTDSFLHRIRGEILLKRDPANTAPAEEAFLTAMAVARQQKAKSFELQAALPLAKLYQSTGRPADARAALAPALEGFSPTPEFPEIAEAQTLLHNASPFQRCDRVSSLPEGRAHEAAPIHRTGRRRGSRMAARYARTGAGSYLSPWRVTLEPAQ